MKLLDKIALNRLLIIISNFILGIIKIFAPKSIETDEKKPRRKILPWRKTTDE